MRTYQEFLEGKMLRAPESGFDPGDDVSDVLFPFQRDIVRWALRGGQAGDIRRVRPRQVADAA